MTFLKMLESIRTPFWDQVAAAVTLLGEETFFMLVGLALVWCFDKRWGFRLLFVGLTGTVLNQLLKAVFLIPRPWVIDPEFTIVETARAGATGYSFPSGHTQSAACVLGMLALMSARSDENLSLRSAEVARQVAELNVSAERSLAELDDALAKAAGAAQSEEDYLARVEAALNEAMTLEGRTVSWKETNDEGRTLACAVELEPFGAFPRFVRTVYHLAIDEGAMEGEDLLFDAGYIGEL